MRSGLVGNRAKLNFLTLMWDIQMEKLRFNYIKKNKKKEHSAIIIALGSIPNETRNNLLAKYIAQCKLLHALCFF